jgi:hypothetical protein
MCRTRAADCPQLKPMGWKRGHAVVDFGYTLRKKGPDHLSHFVEGFNCPARLSFSSPTTACLAASLQSTRLQRFFVFFTAGRPQPGLCALILLRHQQY